MWSVFSQSKVTLTILGAPWAMANFFFTGGSGGQRAINLDQVREVSQDTTTGRISISFQPEHTIALDGEVAKQFMDVLGGLKSEAKALAHGAVERSSRTQATPKKRSTTAEICYQSSA
jgi:hypothetical protein